MKTKFSLLLAVALAVSWSCSTQAAISWNSGFAGGGLVPDFDGEVGPGQWSDTRTINSFESGFTIQTVSVLLEISGGYNGDLYVSLRYAPSGGGEGFAVLLNRIGRTDGNTYGYSGAGMNVIFTDGSPANPDIHTAGSGILSGTYSPDARTANPASVTTDSERGAFLSGFNGMNANGEWSLFVADMSGGDQSQIVSWGLDITAVPEPTTVAGLIFCAVFCSAQFALRWRARRSARHS